MDAENQTAPTCGQPKGIERHHTLKLDADDALLLWGILDMQPERRGWSRFDRIARDLTLMVAEDNEEKAE